MALVAVVTGSKSDLPTIEACTQMLTELGIEHEVRVMSAHRAPRAVQEFAAGAADAGFEVIIAAAGMAAHLPGVIASWTHLPVIGVPVAQAGGPGVSGLDSLLSIAQMPPGVPVGSMSINGSKNAALYAASILALKHEPIRKALLEYREKQSG